MATSIFFNGRRIVVPQATARIDASALAAVSPSSVGIVALIGEAEGGEPLTVADANDVTRADALRDKYRSGDLKTGGLFAFDPSSDDAVPGGAQRIIPVKVNPSTKATATLPDGDPKDSVDLTSNDWGLFTNQINIDVAAGTVKGKLITIVFEDTTETFDDVGGDAIMDVLYTPGADGYDTMTGAITAAAFTAAATKAEAGLDTELTTSTPVGLPAGLEAVSSSAGDTTQQLTVYGLVGTTATRETITLNGTTAVPTTVLLWDKVLGAQLDVAAVGTVTLRVAGAGATALTLAPAVLTRGIVVPTNTPADGVATVSIDVDTALDVALFGVNDTGSNAQERFDMTTGNTTPVVGTVDLARIDVMALGDTAAARTVTVTINAVATSNSVFNTVQKLVDRLNSLSGFTANALVSNATTFLVADADYATAVSLTGTAADFFGDLFAFISAINDGSQFVTAARAAGATGVPANVGDPIFLTGGSEGTTTITQWQSAFSLLRGRRANIIVPLTRDPAVHSLLLSHLVDRAGEIARSAGEANGYVGHADTADAALALATLKSEVVVLQSRHLSHLAQRIERFDPDTGLATLYPSYIHAAIAAGMQAGSPIGEPLTRKRPTATDIEDGPDWTIADNVDELIDAGIMVAEKVDGIGIRYVRSVTGHLADDNLAFSEMSANESANTATFELRRALELMVGKRALNGTVPTIKSLAQDTLERLVTDEIIVAFRALQVEQVGDVFPVSVEIAPVVPVNFIPITVHLVAVRAAA